MRAWFVTVVLLCVALSPVLISTTELEHVPPSASSSPLQVTLSSSSGWTSGGEGLTITGTGFQEMADRNVSYDGVNHQWAATNLDMSDQAGRWNAIDIDSNGHIHVVQIKDGNYEIRHSVNDGTGWNSVKINDCGNTYCWDIHMVIDDNDHIHLAYTTYTSWSETLVYMNYDGTTWTDYTVSSSAHFGPIGMPLTQTIVHTSPTLSTEQINAVMDSGLPRTPEHHGPKAALTREAIGDVNLRSSLTRAITSTLHTKTVAHQN